MVKSIAPALALALVVGACAQILGLDGDVAIKDAGVAETGTAGAGGTTPGCPDTGRGPTMKRVPSGTGWSCVDTREVSVGQYRAYASDLASHPADVLGLLGDARQKECAQYSPSDLTSGAPPIPTPLKFFPDATDDDLPVTSVNFCDATAFCSWAGKRMCGAVRGGPGDDQTTYADAAHDEWTNACTSGGKYRYAYGDTYNAASCSNARRLSPTECGSPGIPCEPTPVDFVDPNAPCTSPDAAFAGIYDMPGNVWEWTRVCRQSAGAWLCIIRGGTYGDTANLQPGQADTAQVGCLLAFQAPGNDAPGSDTGNRSDDLGFRCCADPIAK